jgi:hypothetical protein
MSARAPRATRTRTSSGAVTAIGGSGLAGTSAGEETAEIAPAADPAMGGGADGGRAERRRWVWPAGYALAAVALFFCYLRIAGTQPVTSDGATLAAQAWDMLHGNWLLKGWTLTDVSFYTTELPELIVVETFRGFGAFDVHIAAALTYTLLVLLAGLLAKGRKTGAEGLVRVLIASGIMIAPQVGHGAFILLLSPDHTGTGVPVLVTWLLLDRAPRRWWVPVLACLTLIWALDGDRVVLLTAVAPLVLVTGTRAYQAVIQRREPVAGSWFELSLAAAAIGAAALSSLSIDVIRHLGGFRLEPAPSDFSSVQSMSEHFWWVTQGVFALYGSDFYSMKLHHSVALVLLHFVGLALAATAVCLGVRRFLAGGDLIVPLLTSAVLINLGLYLFSTVPVSIWSGREIAFILPAGAVLAGRTLAGPVMRKKLLPLLGLVGLGYLVALGYGVTRPQQPAEGQNLADWLVAHHLSYGLSGYGFGPATTVASGGRVQLRQATWLRDRIAPGPEEFDTSWYDPAKHDANFVVAPVKPGPSDQLSTAQVTRIFGPPVHVYHVGGQFIIMTYDYNLLKGPSGRPPA